MVSPPELGEEAQNLMHGGSGTFAVCGGQSRQLPHHRISLRCATILGAAFHIEPDASIMPGYAPYVPLLVGSLSQQFEMRKLSGIMPMPKDR